MDVLRTLAILLVVIFHGLLLVPNFPGKVYLFFLFGYLGVELFFVLSGFLIGTILIHRTDKNTPFSFQDVLHFWIRRWFRTLPNYLLFLAINIIIVSYCLQTAQYSFPYFVFLQNFAWPCGQLMPESWSLAVEEWFYLTIPILMFVFTKFSDKRRYSVLVCILCYILFFSAIRFSVFADQSLDWDSGIRKVVMPRLDAIGYGVLIAYLINYYPNYLRSISKKMICLALLLTLILSVFYCHGLETEFASYFYRTAFFSIVSISLSMVIPFLKNMKCKNDRVRYTITHISIISYSMYLVHYSIAMLLSKYLLNHSISWMLSYVCYIVVTVALSTISYKYYEKPTTDIRERITSVEINRFLKFASRKNYRPPI